MIPTIFINQQINQKENTSRSIIKLTSDCIFQNLLTAIDWAIENDEDVIYCISYESKVRIENLKNINELIYGLINQKCYFYYVDCSYEEKIQIDQNKSVLINLKEVHSFILTRPVYKYLKKAIMDLSTTDKLLENYFHSFMKALFPFYMSIHSQKKIPYLLLDNKIKVISPYRNVVEYIDDFIASTMGQVYQNFNIYFIDDCSTDNTISKIPTDPKVSIQINIERQYALKNILTILLSNDFSDSDIICLIDPDDSLPHNYIFSMLNSIYSDKSIFMTYGSMGYMNSLRKFGKKYSKEEFLNARQLTWWVSPLRTFKFSVFKELLIQDPMLKNFKDESEIFLKMPWDMALMFPMMEICGYNAVKFIDSIMYKYRLHENNDMYVNGSEQYRGETIIRKKPRMTKIDLENR